MISNFILHKIKIDCFSGGVFDHTHVIQSYNSTFDGQGFKISGIRLETDQKTFGLIRTITNGGVVKHFTIENSSMLISGLTIQDSSSNFGFFFGNSSASNEPGNITISECHSINNTITFSGNGRVIFLGFIAGKVNNRNYPPNPIPFIFVSNCSTKYSNLISSSVLCQNIGGNFGAVGLIFSLNFFFFFLLFFHKTVSNAELSIDIRNLESIGNNFQMLAEQTTTFGGNIGTSLGNLENLISFNNTINGKIRSLYSFFLLLTVFLFLKLPIMKLLEEMWVLEEYSQIVLSLKISFLLRIKLLPKIRSEGM